MRHTHPTRIRMMQQILRLRDVMTRTGLARSTVYLRMRQQRFPQCVQLGSTHVVGWIAAEVDEWIASQIRAARSEPRTDRPHAA